LAHTQGLPQKCYDAMQTAGVGKNFDETIRRLMNEYEHETGKKTTKAKVMADAFAEIIPLLVKRYEKDLAKARNTELSLSKRLSADVLRGLPEGDYSSAVRWATANMYTTPSLKDVPTRLAYSLWCLGQDGLENKINITRLFPSKAQIDREEDLVAGERTDIAFIARVERMHDRTVAAPASSSEDAA